MRDLWAGKDLTHMKEHLSTTHPEHKTPKNIQEVAEVFEFKVLRRHTSTLLRQLHEAISISRAEGSTLNNRDEYSRCIIPTLSTGQSKTAEPQATPTTQQETEDPPTDVTRGGGELEIGTKRDRDPQEPAQKSKRLTRNPPTSYNHLKFLQKLF